MWDSFIQALQAQLQNQIFAGGLALGIAGLVIGLFHRAWPPLWGLMKRACSSSLQ